MDKNTYDILADVHMTYDHQQYAYTLGDIEFFFSHELHSFRIWDPKQLFSLVYS